MGEFFSEQEKQAPAARYQSGESVQALCRETGASSVQAQNGGLTELRQNVEVYRRALKLLKRPLHLGRP